MTQLFGPRANRIFRSAIVLVIAACAAGLFALNLIPRSPRMRGVNAFVRQEVPFSHDHHTGEVGIDCHFCHNFPEKGPCAGVPQTQICMKCHRVLFKEAPMLEPVRRSFTTGTPLVWNEVYRLPDFVYFDHSIHRRKGVACDTCHGDVAHMPLMCPRHDFTMRWCLACHRDAGRYLGADAGADLVRAITDCGTCHR